MRATVLGVQPVDYKKDGERKQGMRFFLSFPSEGVEGAETGFIYWNANRQGKPPKLAVGDTVDVSYNKYGNLRFGV